MALQPVNRRSVPEDVFEQIAAEVLSGQMQPGEPLPSERRLAEVLGVDDGAWAADLFSVTGAGTFERGNWSTEVDPATATRILASHRALFDGFRC